LDEIQYVNQSFVPETLCVNQSFVPETDKVASEHTADLTAVLGKDNIDS